MSEHQGNDGVLKGVVKWFNDAKGFGFIEHSSGRDVFVHYSVIEQEGFKTLEDGEAVEYEMREGPKGLQAVRVSRTNIPEKVVEAGSEESVANGEMMEASQGEMAEQNANAN